VLSQAATESAIEGTKRAAEKEFEMKAIQERKAAEQKDAEAKEQAALNLLAETDPDEYDRRIKLWHTRKVAESISSETGGNLASKLQLRKDAAKVRRSNNRSRLRPAAELL
jgi:hypothetical protein